MIEEDEGMYDAITQYASQDKISYVHFRVRCVGPPPLSGQSVLSASSATDDGNATAERHRSGPGL